MSASSTFVPSPVSVRALSTDQVTSMNVGPSSRILSMRSYKF